MLEVSWKVTQDTPNGCVIDREPWGVYTYMTRIEVEAFNSAIKALEEFQPCQSG